MRFHFIAGKIKSAYKIKQELIKKYSQTDWEQADIIVVLGGDGTMLQALHRFMHYHKPIYGMNCGSVGFLMNQYQPNNLEERVSLASLEKIHPLKMIATSRLNESTTHLAINEVSLFRQSYQAAKIKISIDNVIRMEELICDGIMLATAVGSTAYNLSAQGPILPLSAPLMALTPVSPFRPRRWRGALIPNHLTVQFDLLESNKRPVNVAADNIEIKSVHSITVYSAKDITASILFDSNHSWEERVLSEQFHY